MTGIVAEDAGDRIRVCHLVDESLDYPLLRSILRHHDRRRYSLIFGSTRPRGALHEAMGSLGAETFALGAIRRASYPMAVLRLARVLRHERVAILHAHLFDPTVIGLLAARMAGVRFVFTRHHSDHHHRMGKRWHVRIDSWCARNADHVFAVSEATRRILTEKEGAPVDRVSVVYNGVETLAEPAPARLDELRRELGVAGRPVCLMIGRLHEEKGHRFLFEALDRMQTEAGPLLVLLAGSGSLRESLERDVQRRGLSETVRFLGRRADIASLIAISNVVVLPSLAESFGLSLVEAMTLGKPVIACSVGGVPEVVEDGVGGLLVPPRDADALRVALLRVLTDPKLATRLGEAGRKRAEFFSEEKMVTGYERAYEITMGQPAST